MVSHEVVPSNSLKKTKSTDPSTDITTITKELKRAETEQRASLEQLKGQSSDYQNLGVLRWLPAATTGGLTAQENGMDLLRKRVDILTSRVGVFRNALTKAQKGEPVDVKKLLEQKDAQDEEYRKAQSQNGKALDDSIARAENTQTGLGIVAGTSGVVVASTGVGAAFGVMPAAVSASLGAHGVGIYALSRSSGDEQNDVAAGKKGTPFVAGDKRNRPSQKEEKVADRFLTKDELLSTGSEYISQKYGSTYLGALFSSSPKQIDSGNFILSAERIGESKPENPAILKELNEFRQSVQKSVDPRSDFYTNLNNLRETVYDYVGAYEKSQGTFFNALENQSTNCVGRTIAMVEAIKSSKLALPEGVKVGVQVYTDHLEPVLYNEKDRTALGLIDGKHRSVIDNPIYNPDVLIQQNLEKLDPSSKQTSSRDALYKSMLIAGTNAPDGISPAGKGNIPEFGMDVASPINANWRDHGQFERYDHRGATDKSVSRPLKHSGLASAEQAKRMLPGGFDNGSDFQTIRFSDPSNKRVFDSLGTSSEQNAFLQQLNRRTIRRAVSQNEPLLKRLAEAEQNPRNFENLTANEMRQAYGLLDRIISQHTNTYLGQIYPSLDSLHKTLGEWDRNASESRGREISDPYPFLKRLATLDDARYDVYFGYRYPEISIVSSGPVNPVNVWLADPHGDIPAPSPETLVRAMGRFKVQEGASSKGQSSSPRGLPDIKLPHVRSEAVGKFSRPPTPGALQVSIETVKGADSPDTITPKRFRDYFDRLSYTFFSAPNLKDIDEQIKQATQTLSAADRSAITEPYRAHPYMRGVRADETRYDDFDYTTASNAEHIRRLIK